jgi:hypothetical protein
VSRLAEIGGLLEGYRTIKERRADVAMVEARRKRVVGAALAALSN